MCSSDLTSLDIFELLIKRRLDIGGVLCLRFYGPKRTSSRSVKKQNKVLRPVFNRLGKTSLVN